MEANENSVKKFSPISLTTPIRFHDELPIETDVVIVGGGIIGVATALSLTEQGLRVLVLEKGRVAAEQSSRNWGWIRQTGRDAAELPIMIEALDVWRGLESKTGESALKFIQQGVVYLASSEQELREFEAFSELAKEHSVDSRLLTATEVSKLYPSSTHRWLGGLHTPSDGRVEPWFAVPQLAAAACIAGVQVREQCAVTDLDVLNGRIQGVVTEEGRVRAERVLLCGGAWTSLLARVVGLSLPQLSVKSTVIRVEGLSQIGDGNIGDGNSADSRIAFACRDDGGYTVALSDHHDFYIGPDAFRYLKIFQQARRDSIQDTHLHLASPAGFPDAWRWPKRRNAAGTSPFEKTRILDPDVDSRLVDEMLKRLRNRFSGLDNIKVTHRWAGMIDTMPDFVPIMDESPISGLFIATGFSGHGYGIGPGAASVMARKMTGKLVEHDLSRFRYDRFGDGAPLVLGPH